MEKGKSKWRPASKLTLVFCSLDKGGMATPLDHFFLAPSAATRLPASLSLGGNTNHSPVRRPSPSHTAPCCRSSGWSGDSVWIMTNTLFSRVTRGIRGSREATADLAQRQRPLQVSSSATQPRPHNTRPPSVTWRPPRAPVDTRVIMSRFVCDACENSVLGCVWCVRVLLFTLSRDRTPTPPTQE